MKLMLVESPAKTPKVELFLGAGWKVMATYGHVRDLPKKSLGVDPDHDFRQTYEVTKPQQVKKLLKAIDDAEALYLATDPDREGEAIAWHVCQLAGKALKGKPVFRVTFTAITQDAVRQAVKAAHAIDMNLVEAQLARRAVDRLIGYPLSSLAGLTLNGNFSAGRVQSVGLRLVVEREREIEKFVPKPYWTFDVLLKNQQGAEVQARVMQVQGAPAAEITDARIIAGLKQALPTVEYIVTGVKTGKKDRSPHPPFTTSALQQAASQALGWSPEETMRQAQKLYEGGYITYMRTDAVAVAAEAQEAALDYIAKTYGPDFVPVTPHTYKAKAAAQEAHEAIRPVKVYTDPESLAEAELSQPEEALYGLIWKRFVASQMSVAVYDTQIAQIGVRKDGKPLSIGLEARGRVLRFPGFLAVWQDPPDADADDEQHEDRTLPVLREGEVLRFIKVQAVERQTKAPARFTEASLVQQLERDGIGRPSTYATILEKLKAKQYVVLQKKRLIPTARGLELWDYLDQRFSPVLARTYTAQLEDELDLIAGGQKSRSEVLEAFYQVLKPMLQGAGEETLHLKRQREEAMLTGENCPECGQSLVFRRSKNGVFVGCSGYPICKYVSPAKSSVVSLKPLKK